MLLILGLLCAFSEKTAMVTSEEWDHLNFQTTGQWVPFQDGWVIVASNHSQNVISIWVWREEGEMSLLLESGPREGIFAVSALTVIPGKNTLALRCMLTGRIFYIDLDSPEPEFKRTHHTSDLAGDMVFWDGETLIGGAHSLKLEQYGGEKPWTHLAQVNRLLPDDTDHPSHRRISVHKMRMAKAGNRLIIGFSLYPRYIQFSIGDKVEREIEDISFRGYVKPPDDFVEDTSNESIHEYLASFHHLRELAWYGDQIMARFKRGFNSFGTWVSLEKPELLTWDNDVEQEKIFAIGNSEVVIATLVEDDEGLVKCSLRRQSSFPSR